MKSDEEIAKAIRLTVKHLQDLMDAAKKCGIDVSLYDVSMGGKADISVRISRRTEL